MGTESSKPGPALGRTTGVLRLADIGPIPVAALLGRFGLELAEVESGVPIPGSFWGDEEAGLVGDRLLARPDTPLHSILHEACHYICMDPARRHVLETDAGGDYDEENAVCYLQIQLAGHLSGVGRERMMVDMDAWGYTFRLGSAAAWFAGDAEDARAWLQKEGILDGSGSVTWACRGNPR